VAVRIYVSPTLVESRRTEVEWTLRTLLTGIGRSWNLTTDASAAVDVVYAPAGESHPRALVELELVVTAWEHPSAGAAERLRAWLGAASSLGGYDPLADCFAVLTGADESVWERDRHGHHVPPSQDAALIPRQAVVSAFAAHLETLLSPQLRAPDSVPWPHGKRFAVVFTHDVDYPEVVRFLEPLRALLRLRAIGPSVGLTTGRLHHWHFGSWMAHETEREMRSAFFFVARQGSLLQYARGVPDPFYDIHSARFKRLFAELEEHGFEIGLQPSYLAWREPAALAREKLALEEAAGTKVHGGRHHYWQLDRDDPEETSLAHEAAGLEYDCSFAFERLVGWRRGVSWPFHPFSRRLRRPSATLQLSTVWMDDQLFSYAELNGVRSAEDRRALLGELVARASSTGGALVADMHEYVFDDRLYPGWRAAYDMLWELVAARSDAWIATPADVTSHWLAHEQRLVAASCGFA